MTKHMVNIFTSFAATGHPGWNASTGEENRAPLYGCNIHESNEYVGELPEVERMEIWDTFYNAASRFATFNLWLCVLILIKTIV